MSSICVYCSSSKTVDSSYMDAARELGAALALSKHRLIFGGTDIGLMGALGQAARRGGTYIIGVVPEIGRGSSLVFEADEVIFTPDLRTRKKQMELFADAFIVLPGGFGTLDEFFEILTLKQLKFHAKPIVLLNHRGFFDPLLGLIEHLFDQSFASAAQHRRLFHVASDIKEALEYLDSYVAPEHEIQWS